MSAKTASIINGNLLVLGQFNLRIFEITFCFRAVKTVTPPDSLPPSLPPIQSLT